jgi:hypothetical protein
MNEDFEPFEVKVQTISVEVCIVVNFIPLTVHLQAAASLSHILTKNAQNYQIKGNKPNCNSYRLQAK